MKSDARLRRERRQRKRTRSPTDEGFDQEKYNEILKQLRAPLDEMVPTPLMWTLLIISIAIFIATVCFVRINDYQRTHVEETNK